MTKSSEGKLIYHITHKDNILNILDKGLKSRALLDTNSFSNIADMENIKKRENKIR